MCFSLVLSCPSLRWLLVTVTVDAKELVRRLAGQLSSDRHLTIFIDGASMQLNGSV